MTLQFRSSGTQDFWNAYWALPAKTRRIAKRAYRDFSQNPLHPGLHFKCVEEKQRVYSVRIGLGYRAVGVVKKSLFRRDEIIWFWIGDHASYDRLIASL